jgi:hypothetical protein
MKINNMVEVSSVLIFKLICIVIYDILQLCNKQNKIKKAVQQQTVQTGLIVKY